MSTGFQGVVGVTPRTLGFRFSLLPHSQTQKLLVAEDWSAKLIHQPGEKQAQTELQTQSPASSQNWGFDADCADFKPGRFEVTREPLGATRGCPSVSHTLQTSQIKTPHAKNRRERKSHGRIRDAKWHLLETVCWISAARWKRSVSSTGSFQQGRNYITSLRKLSFRQKKWELMSCWGSWGDFSKAD